VSAKPRITDDQIAWARHLVNRRREIERQLSLMPTLEEIAENLECSKRYLEMIVKNRVRTVPRGAVIVRCMRTME
jgi:hypothetical protein